MVRPTISPFSTVKSDLSSGVTQPVRSLPLKRRRNCPGSSAALGRAPPMPEPPGIRGPSWYYESCTSWDGPLSANSRVVRPALPPSWIFQRGTCLAAGPLSPVDSARPRRPVNHRLHRRSSTLKPTTATIRPSRPPEKPGPHPSPEETTADSNGLASPWTRSHHWVRGTSKLRILRSRWPPPPRSILGRSSL